MLFRSAVVVLSGVSVAAGSFVNTTLCNSNNYTYQALAGYGLIPSAARDKFGDTIGGIGSSIALDKTQWKKLSNGSYCGVLWALPDRGWCVTLSCMWQQY
jgi:hypothetical protein